IFDGEFVLLAEDGGAYGKFENTAYIMSGKFWVNNHAHILQAIKGKSSNQFILYALNFLDLNPYVVGTTRKKLNQEQMRAIKIPLPSLPEQQKIAEILLTVDKKLELERNEKARLERIKQGLMDLLLTGKIRVKVN
ncbi:MAG: restriction endonuclease subunit S, partial [Nitrososphaerota archaeon]